MTRLRIVTFACSLAVLIAPALGDAQGMDAQRFVPPAGAAGGLLVERAVVPAHLGFGFGFFANWADDPLVVTNRETGRDLFKPIDNALWFDFLGSIGLFGRTEIALHIPVAVWNSGDPLLLQTSVIEAGSGIGDLRLVPKVILLQTGGSALGFALGAAVPITFPTGSSEALRGAGAFTFEPQILLGLFHSRFSVSASIGVRLRTSTDGEDLFGHEIRYGLAGSFSVFSRRDLLDLLLEIAGSGDLQKGHPSATGAPLELLGGIVVKPHPEWHLYAAAGPGLTNGLGTPDVRVVLGVRFARRTAGAYRDSDNDGINDRLDKCPSAPEDYDGFEDEDGCPDEDNDHDGIPDDRDECPDVAEEQGGDGDGCPDRGRVIVKEGKVYVLGKVQFETGSAKILKRSNATLDEIAEALNGHPELKYIVVEGHTDDVGYASFNTKLSEQRARAVRRALVQRSVDGRRLGTSGQGEDRPLAPNTTPAGRAKNRRVEFIIDR